MWRLEDGLGTTFIPVLAGNIVCLNFSIHIERLNDIVENAVRSSNIANVHTVVYIQSQPNL